MKQMTINEFVIQEKSYLEAFLQYVKNTPDLNQRNMTDEDWINEYTDFVEDLTNN